MKIGPPNRSHFVELLEYFGTSIDAYPPSCFLNELGPHFSPLSRFYTEGRSRSHLTRPEYEYCWLRKNSPTPKYLDAIVPHHLITNSPCCTRFCFPLLPFPLVIRFFFHHSPPITLHTFPFPCPTNSLLISWFVRISHLRNTIYLFEDKLCRLMSFLLIISDIFREGEYKTEVYKREREKERVPVLKIAQRRKVG